MSWLKLAIRLLFLLPAYPEWRSRPAEGEDAELYLLGGDKSAAVPDGRKAAMRRHNAVVMAVVLLVLGRKFVGDAISGLS